MKGKKLLAGLISAAMVLGTMSVPVFADDEFALNDPIIAKCVYDDNDMYLSVTFGTVPVIEEELKVELYHDTLLLSTTTVTEEFLNDPEENNGTGISAKICLMDYERGTQPNTSGCWDTVINNLWTQSRMPNKIVVTADGETLTSTNFEYWHMEHYSSALTAKDLKDMIDADTDGVIDLDGKTIVLDEEVAVYDNITIKNGTLDISTVYLPNGNGMLGSRGSAGQVMTLEDITIKGKDYSSSYGLLYAGNGTTIVLDNCTIDVENELMKSNCDTSEDKGAVLKSDGSGKFVINGGNFTWKNVVRGICQAEVDIDGATINATHDETSSAHFLRNVYGTIKNSNISADNFQNGVKNKDVGDLNIENSNVALTNMAEYTLNLSGANVVADDESTVTAAAKIGNKCYSTLEAALAAATSEDTIVMLEDATPVLTYATNKYLFTNAQALDLNGHTLTFNQGNVNVNNIEFKSSADEKGTIVVSYGTVSPSYNGAIWITEENSAVTFSNVIIDANKLKDTYLVECWAAGSNVTFNNCEISAVSTNDSAGMSAVVACNNSNTDVTVNNTKITHKNIKGHTILHGNVVISGTSEIISDNVACGIYATLGRDSITVSDTATITITNVLGDEDWNKTAAGIVLEDDTSYEVADTATVNAKVFVNVTPADTVKVVMEDVTAENAEGEKVYDLYLEADSQETIHRLTAAQMQFIFNTQDDLEMTVSAAEGLTYSVENDEHLFNFDGTTAADATAAKIKIGQIKIAGYGAYNLGVEDGQAHATTLDGENVVTDYIVGGKKLGKGDFDLGESIEDRIEVPTRELTINITFPNTVEENVVAYQKMSVKIGDETIALGEGEGENVVAMEDGKYVITKELVYNTPYTVEVSGEGYRTARYTVTMNEDKTLNFWNNVKDIPEVVEVGKESSKKNVTFLAGELVKDGKINIYDLSAVVSYFGTINDVTGESAYSRYDLNRDGKIDSKDVAYVLVSWGK